jgi:mono/diheme cytochrome c family protein
MKKLSVCIVILLLIAACNTTSKKDVAALPEALPESEGEQLYLDMKCPSCHGYQGMGDGFLSDGLFPKPADFSSAEAMKSVEDDELAKAIRKGKGIGMPAYPLFTDHQVDALVRYVRSLSQSASN